ncbi:unnamed protein product [Brassica oleracea]|uniref:(rape) hypothetical protein n=1 Tax=Brassica napus TaxID=3708 RepID=A0A816J3Q8_BRANA|nr:unnamed protein product [Brassica napus]
MLMGAHTFFIMFAHQILSRQLGNQFDMVLGTLHWLQVSIVGPRLPRT